MSDREFVLQILWDSLQTIVKLNLNTGEITCIKGDEAFFSSFSTFSLSDFFPSAEKIFHVHPDDLYKFELLNDLKNVKQQCKKGTSGDLFSYRVVTGDTCRWARIHVFVPQTFCDEQPYIILGHRYISPQEHDMEESSNVFGRKMLKVLRYDPEQNAVYVILQPANEERLTKRLRKVENADEDWPIISGLVYKDDIPGLRQFTNRKSVLKQFENGTEELSHYYRRKINGFYRWVKLSFRPSSEYTSKHPIYYGFVEDVDDSLTKLLEEYGNRRYFSKALSSEVSGPDHHENLLSVLSYFTQRYMEFFLVDLRHDLYVMYKFTPEIVSGKIPYVGCFSQLARRMIKQIVPAETRDQMMNYVEPSFLRSYLKDKPTISTHFSYKGKHDVKITLIRIETANGIPTKLVVCTEPAEQENQLKVSTFGNFDVFDTEGRPIKFTKKQSKQLLAYLIDKHGYPVTPGEIAMDVLERHEDDLNAIKYISTLARMAQKDLERAGYTDIIIKEWRSLRINPTKIDCDYYHLLDGDARYLHQYHNEYMKEYSWAEETNAEIRSYFDR